MLEVEKHKNHKCLKSLELMTHFCIIDMKIRHIFIVCVIVCKHEELCGFSKQFPDKKYETCQKIFSCEYS